MYICSIHLHMILRTTIIHVYNIYTVNVATVGYASNAWLVGLLFGNLQKIAAKYTGFEVKKSSTLS